MGKPARLAALALLVPVLAAGGKGAAQGLEPISVYPGHPRLIVGGYRGVSVAELRAACARPELKAQCDQLGGQHILDDAMRYLVFDDRAAAQRVEAELKALPDCDQMSDLYEQTALGGYALAFDWVHDALGDPAPIERRLGECAMLIAGDRGLRSDGPHLWHGYTSQAAALALAALSVDDGFAERAALLDQAVELFRHRALEAYEVVGGAWPEGYNYERTHFFSSDPPRQYVMDALRAWDSAVAQDDARHASIFETIAAEEGDWLRSLAYHLVYGTVPGYATQPKRTLLRGGDMPTGQAYPNRQYRPFVDSIARVYGDGALAAWGRSLEEEWGFVGGSGTYHPIHRYSLPYNLPLDVPSQASDGLALGRIWGRSDLGYVISRSGWGDDATVVAYRAGKWFTGHQHMDQGHIDIWHRGPLAVDAGVYASWGTEHREAYYMRTVAHNTLLVQQPGEDFAEHPGSGVNANDGGQRILTYTGCAQCMQSVAEWRSNIGSGLHFEAGTIEAFENGPDYTVIASDITSAYDSERYAAGANQPKVALVQRDLVFWRPSLLVVTDRVRLSPGASAPQFVLHFPSRPSLTDPQVRQGTADDGILTSYGRSFAVDNRTGGILAGRDLVDPTSPPVPGDMVSEVAIGGLGYRYWVDGANRAGGAAPHELAPAEPGLWRLELASARPDERDHLLVEALTITDTNELVWEPFVSGRLLPCTTDPLSAPALAAGLHLASGTATRIVVRSAAIPRAAVRFASLTPPPGPVGVALLLADLAPGATYRVAADRAVLAEGRASAEGVLQVGELALDGPRQLVIGHCPPLLGAGQAWRDLCATGVTPSVTPARATATGEPEETPVRLWLPLAHRSS